jgi:microcystin-dependent protein
MASPFLAEIRMFSFNFPPKGWGLCNGQLLPINQNQALFSLLGTTYGGNGVTTFALPDLRGRAPIHFDGNHVEGALAGQEAHTLISAELAAHTHSLNATNDTANQTSPGNNALANPLPERPYQALSNPTTLNPQAISNVGGGQPHNNMQPYLVINFCIALVGIFPSRN